MSGISLTASMRSNLLSLQNTQKLMDTTQERLSTGNKVNSAIDNPSSYYTAQSLNNRASDLSSLLDSMGQAISTIKAADEGITAITSFVEQAKAVASSALDTTDAEERKEYMAQFNSIRAQIDSLAKDSGYKGINLINGDDLTVTFNETRTSSMTIKGQNATTTGLELDAGADWDKDLATATAALATAEKALADNTDADQVETLTTAVTTAQSDLKKAQDDSKAAINTSIEATTNAINKLRTMSSELGNNYSIVQTREDFTQNLINVLEEGADKLTLADMNEESANMLALQTRQQLAINSLSLASQAAQSVLKLF